MDPIAQAPAEAAAAGGGWLAISPVLALLLAAGALMMLRHEPRVQAGIALFAHGAALALTALLLSRVLSEGPAVMALGGWPYPFGVSIVADGFGAALALTASVAGLAAAVAALGADESRTVPPLLALMQAGACGAVLTGDLFNFYVWFEIILVAAIGLTVVTGSGRRPGCGLHAVAGLCGSAVLLLAVALLFARLGTLNLAEMAGRISGLSDRSPLHAVVAVLVLALAFKAAVVPVALRVVGGGRAGQAAAAVAVGLSLLAGACAMLRLLVLVMPDIRTEIADGLIWAAMGAMLLGSLAALARTDLHHVGGCAVVSVTGIAISGIALGTEFGVAGAVFLTVHVAIVATGLFLAFGLVAGEGGGVRAEGTGGPFFSALLLVLLLSIAGLPPFAGFWPRVLLAQAALVEGHVMLAAAILSTGLIMTIAVLSAFAGAVWTPAAPSRRADEGSNLARAGPTAAGRSLVLAPVVMLAGLSLLFGLWPAPIVTVVDAATAALIDAAAYSAAMAGTAP